METIKSFINRDGNVRVSIYREEYPDNPRNTTDFPLHCVDFSQDFSIMLKTDDRYREQRDFLGNIFGKNGNAKKIIDFLVNSGKHLNNTKCNNALIYNHKEKCWELVEYSKYYGEKEFSWKQQESYYCPKYDIDIYSLLQNVTDSTINYLLDFLTDEIKITSYGFCYDGSMYFEDSIDTDNTGFIWLNKTEYLKYTGANEESWKELKITEIGSSMLCTITGICTQGIFDNTIAYIQSWIKALKNDNKMIVWAASRAEKAAMYIQNLNPVTK